MPREKHVKIRKTNNMIREKIDKLAKMRRKTQFKKPPL
jgi:hypothetical protein